MASSLESWFTTKGGLGGTKLEAALDCCKQHVIEDVDDLCVLHEKGKLNTAFPQALVLLAIEDAFALEKAAADAETDAKFGLSGTSEATNTA